MCLFPKLIKNPKYKSTKKNGGLIPPVFDDRVKMIPIGCGKCMECRKKKAREWNVRLQEELRHTKLKGYFMTLTFSDESLVKLEEIARQKGFELDGYELDNKIASIAVRRFTENWRVQKKHSLRHWLITELGHVKTERIHLHGLIWTDEPKEDLDKFWRWGTVDTGKFVNEKSVNYIVKYLHKVDIDHKHYVPKMYVSNGIGKGYLERFDSKRNGFVEGRTDELYRNKQGFKMALPIYYRNKIYSEEERELLWIEKLDKEERYVNGVRVDISEGEEEYERLLRMEQAKNRRLGYGDDTVNWETRRVLII
jgi:hypothetical protein